MMRSVGDGLAELEGKKPKVPLQLAKPGMRLSMAPGSNPGGPWAERLLSRVRRPPNAPSNAARSAP